MAGFSAAVATHLGATERRDAWWLSPVATAVGFGIFIVYTTWRAFEGALYESGPYLSPFYSPHFLLVHTWPSWWPGFLQVVPLFILWMPGGFRATCYYYRKAYYRSYFLDPPACAVDEFRGESYTGETRFPFLLQNLHRYFFYLAVLVLVFLWVDALRAFRFPEGVGVRLGSLILLGNVLLLSCYTFSCHSFRHLIGGKLDFFSRAPAGPIRCAAWDQVSGANRHHMLWAWLSLFSVGFADLYVRMVAAGIWTDFRLL